MSNLRREALKRVLNALQGGSKPSEKVLERVLDDIAKEAPIVPRNIGTKLESPFTGGAIKDVRLVRGVPHTTEYSTVIVPHDPSKKIRAERRQVTHRPQWQTEGWDSELQNWDLLETHYPAGYKDPIYGIANKISGNVDALEALARYTSAAAGKDVDLARYISGLKPPIIKKSLNALIPVAAVGGGMGVLDLLSPSKADASPVRFVTKKVSGPVSSTAKRLIGHEISGMTIKNVVKGKGDVRYITFEGTDYVMGVNKNTLHSLAREFGSEVYPETAEALGGARGLKMAIKSAERLLNLKNTGPYTKDELAAIEAKHINNLQELELSAAKKVWFKYRGEKIHLLEPYARILENYNLGKRVK